MQSLGTELQASGYQLDHPAVFSCLGVTQYLSAVALQTTLAPLAHAAAGSHVIVGYLVAEKLLDADNRRVRTFLNVVTAACGEPILTDFTPAAFRTHLEAWGWTALTDLGAESGLAHYTAGRTDGLQHPQTHRLLHARVGNPPTRAPH